MSAGAQREVVDRLFHAYFVEGRDVSDRAVDTAMSKTFLEGANADAVREEIGQA